MPPKTRRRCEDIREQRGIVAGLDQNLAPPLSVFERSRVACTYVIIVFGTARETYFFNTLTLTPQSLKAHG
jgi:hypothetical protein